MSELTDIRVRKFQSSIWSFYKKNKREMLWRGEKDPYKVLVSEIMLQQTQVTRVTEKYVAFIKRFPSLRVLAAAPLHDVLLLWSGLGYNRRAVFLHKLSQIVVLEYKGVLPSERSILRTLPGIGEATAGSISAFAFNKPVAFVETNIRSVYTYCFFKSKKSVTDKEIYTLVEQTIDKKKPREWYYALMDYGSYLKSNGKGFNKKSTHYTKQKVFKGSNREVRGAILKFLTKYGSVNIKKLPDELGFEIDRVRSAIESLLKENIIHKKGLIISI